MRNIQFLLKGIQDTYAHSLDLSIAIVDIDGHILVEPCQRSEISRYIFNDEAIFNEMQNNIILCSPFEKSIIVDSIADLFIGMKWIVTPIKINEGAKLFLLAGPFVESSSVKNIMKENLRDYSQLIEELKIIENENNIEREISKLAEMMKEIIKTNNTIYLQTFLLSTQKLIGSYENMSSIIEEIYNLYEEFRNNQTFGFPEVLLFGMANVTENQLQFSVVKGKNSKALLGNTFYFGEGFLGHAATRKEPIIWSEITNDPRGESFTKYGINLSSLLCIPIRDKQEVYGVIFIGLSNKWTISKKIMDYLYDCATRIAQFTTKSNTNKEKIEVERLIKLNKELVEIVGNSTLNVENRLFYILDLFREFSKMKDLSLVYKQDNILKYIARGDVQEKAKLQEIYKKYEQDPLEKDKAISVSNCVLVELPIFIDDDLQGLVVGQCIPDQQIKNELLYYCVEVIKNFIVQNSQTKKSLLPIIDEETLKQLEEDEEHAKNLIHHITNIKPTIQSLPLSKREKEVLYFVLEGLTNQEIGEELYISIHTVKNHLTKIFKKLNVQDRNEAFALVYRIKYELADK